jgi:hypothetical protein
MPDAEVVVLQDEHTTRLMENVKSIGCKGLDQTSKT